MPPIRAAVETRFGIKDKMKEQAGIRKAAIEIHATISQTVLIIVPKKLQWYVRSDAEPAVCSLKSILGATFNCMS